MAIKTLHFVYNVEATPQALVKDFVHRLVEPETYPCKLCDVTYGRFMKKPRWQRFLWSLPVKSAAHTRNRFIKRHPHLRDQRFPVVLAEDEAGEFTVFISTAELQGMASLEALERQVTTRLAQP